MSDKKDEKVLVVSAHDVAAVRDIHGFEPDDGSALTRLLKSPSACFRPRSEVEDDPEWKQLIPYVVIRWQRRRGNRYLSYARASSGGESRLHDKSSIGVGGHVNDRDSANGNPEDAFFAGMLREIKEEVSIRCDFTFQPIGLIHDTSDAVGRVHLGVVQVCDVDSDMVTARERDLLKIDFRGTRSLVEDRDSYEGWSRILIDELEGGGW